jgi:hypothetical protein
MALKYDQAVNELIRLLETRPSQHFHNNDVTMRVSFPRLKTKEGYTKRENILQASLLLFGDKIEVNAYHKIGIYADIQCGSNVLTDKKNDQKPYFVWLKPIQGDIATIEKYPFGWIFSVSSECGQYPDYIQDLYSLITPRLFWFDASNEKSPSTDEQTRKGTINEVKARAEWITAACGIVKRLLCNYFDKNNQDNIISESNKAELIDFISKYAVTNANWSSNESRDTNTDIKYPLRWTFLKEFPREQISSLCNDENDVPPLYQSFLADLASTASEQDFSFIEKNSKRLPYVFNAEQVHIKYRAWAGMALFLHGTIDRVLNMKQNLY